MDWDTDQKPHPCHLCHSTFINADLLKEHHCIARGADHQQDSHAMNDTAKSTGASEVTVSQLQDTEATVVQSTVIKQEHSEPEMHLGQFSVDRIYSIKPGTNCPSTSELHVPLESEHCGTEADVQGNISSLVGSVTVKMEPSDLETFENTEESALNDRINVINVKPEFETDLDVSGLVQIKTEVENIEYNASDSDRTFEEDSDGDGEKANDDKEWNLKELVNSPTKKERKRKIYNCEICLKTYRSRKGFQVHKLWHKGDKPHVCNICGKAFHQKANLMAHERTHTGERPFPCPICAKTFSTSSGMRRHERTHSSDRPYKCTNCPSSFRSYNGLFLHNQLHTGSKAFPCPHCEKRFASKWQLDSHLYLHGKDTRKFKCVLCPMQYRKKAVYRQHLLARHITANFQTIKPRWTYKSKRIRKKSTKSTRNQCIKCGLRFKSRRLLCNHLWKCNIKAVKCDQCCRTFHSELSLKLHSIAHRYRHPYRCLLCAKKYTLVSVLGRHMLAHAYHLAKDCIQKRQNRCDICHKFFSNPTVFGSHMVAVHFKTKYHCTMCDKSFNWKKSLKNHMTIHSGVKAFQCPVCGKCLVSKCNLKKHVKLHTEPQGSFECDKCERVFSSLWILKRHRLEHGGVKTKVCGECGKAFFTSSELASHRRTHGTERKYQCDICEKSYKSSSNLATHKQTHNEKPLECSVCGGLCKNKAALYNHMKKHDPSKQSACPRCGKLFTWSGGLSKHLRSNACLPRTPQYECPVCAKMFPFMKDLNEHIREHKDWNKDQMPYKCDQCEKGFMLQTSLNRHVLTHSRGPIPCELCDKTFSRTYTLKKHIKACHVKKEPE